MNLVTSDLLIVRPSKTKALANRLLIFLLIGLSACLIGCSDRVRLSSAEQLAEFESASPPRRVIDVDHLVRARIGGGPYRVVSGDALEFTMPALLQIVSPEELSSTPKTAPYICRVSDAGTITLPLIGEIEVEGKTRAEIESAVIDAYYPEYSAARPSVFARVLEYQSANVSITGAVQKPGVYSLRSDQMSLGALLMEAQGIVDEGAACIRINRADRVVSNNEAVSINAIEQAVEQLPQRNGARRPEPLARHIGLDKTDYQMVYRQSAGSGTTAELTISYGQRILLTEQLDIASEIKRRALLERLIQREPQVSIATVNQKLSALAERLKLPCVLSYSEYRSASTSTSLNAKRNTSGPMPACATNAALSGRLTAGRSTPLTSNLFEDLNLAKESSATERVKSAKPQGPRSLVLPVEGLNIPCVDVALQDGDAVIVERLDQALITVVGLVNKPGTFPYSPGTQYNLINVLGLAGGLNQVAKPRYATIYRKKHDHAIAKARFRLVDGSKMTDALNVIIKPGDIVAIEQTPRTRTNVILNRIFRLNLGGYVPLGAL